MSRKPAFAAHARSGTGDAHMRVRRVPAHAAPCRSPSPPEHAVLQNLAWIQGAYFIVTGVWPLLSMDTFERVTGPKTDRWLVRTVAVLVIAIGVSIAFGARNGPVGMLRPLATG